MNAQRLGLVAVAMALAATSCANTGFNVEYAPEYSRGAPISFFGVYQDGRVNDDSWDQFGTRFSRSFAGAPCEVLYGGELTSRDADLAGAIDSYARANGVNDDLLEKIAPMAKGDLVAVFSISGHPPQPLTGAAGRSPPPSGPSRNFGGGGSKRGGMGAGGMGGGGSSSNIGAPATDNNVFELSATLYSLKAKRSVAVVAMAYSGNSVEEALAKFTERFQSEMTGARCVGWSWDQKVDADAIRQMVDH